MSEIGGMESFTPGEGGGGASEQVSEAAKQRFAQSQQQARQAAKDEKKSKRRDDRVATTIREFMANPAYSHLFQLISRLSARDCPSIFILCILSLIHEPSKQAVEEFIAEKELLVEVPTDFQASDSTSMEPQAKAKILLWTTQLELVLSLDAVKILAPLMLDETNMEGTVLQLVTFVLIDFMKTTGKSVAYEALQPLTIKILQDLLEPHMEEMSAYFQSKREEVQGKEEDV